MRISGYLTKNNNSITLFAEFYANRVLIINGLDVYGFKRLLTRIVSTQFNLVTNTNISIKQVKASNFDSKQKSCS